MATDWALPKPDLPRLRLTLVRHGESAWNSEKRVQGHLGGGLTATGRAESIVTGAHLAARYPCPDLVVMSDLDRATQSAEPYLRLCGIEGRTDARMREIDNGIWSGRLKAEVADEHADDIERLRLGEDIPRGGAERVADMAARTDEWLQALLVEAGTTMSRGETFEVVGFGHGGPIRLCALQAIGLPFTAYQALGGLGTCSITEVAFWIGPSGRVHSKELDSYNSRHHLR